MRLSHASKALFTSHWEVCCLREVISIWALLPIYILSYKTPELNGQDKGFWFPGFFWQVGFFAAFGSFIMFLCKRSWEELPASQPALKTSHAYEQLQPLSQLICECGNMDIKQPGGLPASQTPASMPPHKPFPPHPGLGNGFHRCTAICQLRSLSRLLSAV